MADLKVPKMLALLSEAVYEASLKHRGDPQLAGVHFDVFSGNVYGTNGREIIVRIDSGFDTEEINPEVPFYNYGEEDYIPSQFIGIGRPFTSTAVVDRMIDADFNYTVVIPLLPTMEKIKKRYVDDGQRYGVKLIMDMYHMTRREHILIPCRNLDRQLGVTRYRNGDWLLEHPVWRKPIVIPKFSKYYNSLDPDDTVYLGETVSENDSVRFVNAFKKLDERRLGVKFGMFNPRKEESFDPFDLDEYLSVDSFFYPHILEGWGTETYYGFDPVIVNLDLFYYCLGVFKGFEYVEIHVKDPVSPICISAVRNSRSAPRIDILLAPVERGQVKCLPE